MAEVQKYEGTVRKQMQEGLTDTEETRAIKEIRQKYKAYYTEQMEKLHQKQAEDVMQGGAVPDDEQIVISTNRGEPLVGTNCLAGKAYSNICHRIMGEEVPFLNLNEKQGVLEKLKDIFKRN